MSIWGISNLSSEHAALLLTCCHTKRRLAVFIWSRNQFERRCTALEMQALQRLRSATWLPGWPPRRCTVGNFPKMTVAELSIPRITARNSGFVAFCAVGYMRHTQCAAVAPTATPPAVANCNELQPASFLPQAMA